MGPHSLGSQRDKGHFLAIFPPWESLQEGLGSLLTLAGLGGNSFPGWGCKPSVALGPLIPTLFAPSANPSPRQPGTAGRDA